MRLVVAMRRRRRRRRRSTEKSPSFSPLCEGSSEPHKKNRKKAKKDTQHTIFFCGSPFFSSFFLSLFLSLSLFPQHRRPKKSGQSIIISSRVKVPPSRPKKTPFLAFELFQKKRTKKRTKKKNKTSHRHHHRFIVSS